jgi:sugar O-acyltransferase (sialic acid O-acetyltransferase NeuD family)
MKNPKKILLFPFGGNARESLIAIFAINDLEREWDIIGFIDDNQSLHGKDCCGIKVVGGREILQDFPDAYVLALPGNPKNHMRRDSIIESLGTDKSRFARIIHPAAVVASDAIIGYNTVIMSNVVISCGVTIGNHCILLPNTVIAHDSSVGDYCCIGSNAVVSGGVFIDSSCYIGSGANIRENLKIGRRTLVGLGSVVISNIQHNVIVAGNPAKVIRENNL